MKEEPLVSIIIPAYNAEKSISKICTSVLDQNYKNIEIIIVNDGSQDKTSKTAKKLKAKDSRVTLISQKNSGVSGARNTGIKNAKGDFIFFFDADDNITPSMISDMVNLAQNHEDTLIVCGRRLSDGSIRIPKEKTFSSSDKTQVLREILRNDILYSPWNKIYSAKIIQEHNISFDKSLRYGEDLAFNLDYLKHVGKIKFVAEPYYLYDLSESGCSSKTSASLEYRKTMKKHLLSFLSYNNYHLSLLDYFLVFLLQTRWRLSVIKSKIRSFR